MLRAIIQLRLDVSCLMGRPHIALPGNRAIWYAVIHAILIVCTRAQIRNITTASLRIANVLDSGATSRQSHWAHDVIATLNQPQWRWFNVAITSCAQWDAWWAHHVRPLRPRAKQAQHIWLHDRSPANTCTVPYLSQMVWSEPLHKKSVDQRETFFITIADNCSCSELSQSNVNISPALSFVTRRGRRAMQTEVTTYLLCKPLLLFDFAEVIVKLKSKQLLLFAYEQLMNGSMLQTSNVSLQRTLQQRQRACSTATCFKPHLQYIGAKLLYKEA